VVPRGRALDGVLLARDHSGIRARGGQMTSRLHWALAVTGILALLIVALPSASWAQAVKGTLLGTITDTQGEAVPGATVTMTETGTNISRTAQTNTSGNYIFSNAKDGTYRVSVEVPGFRKALRDGVVVDVNTTVRVDLTLQIGQLTEEATVTAETPPLQTDRADTGRIIESKQITEIPLSFNRNFQGLLVTVPGATRPFRPHSQFFNSQDSLSTNVNGQQRLANNVMLDGIDNNHKSGLLTVLIPSADAIEAISVSTSNYDAEFGRAGGAVTNVTLKSGTNQLKGVAFFFGNGTGTLAKDYFSGTKADTSYKQFGAALGGPIIKNRLFFFADYQGTRDNLGQVNLHVIPTMDFRNGDFSKAPTTIYDPATGNPDGSGRQPFPGNIIPANRISPIARRLLAFLPAPNINAALGQNNYEFLGVREKKTEAADVKLTYQASSHDSLAYRFSFQRPVVFDPGTFGIYGGPSNGGFAGTGTNKTFSTALNWTRTFGASAILDARAGYVYYHNVAVAQGAGLNTSDDVGIRGANLDDFTSGVTQIEVQNGYASPVLGFSASLPWDRSEKTYNVASTFTKIHGNHSFKVGFDVRHNRDFLLQVQDNGGSRGRYRFNAAQTASPTDSASQNGLANAFASFLLDVPSLVSRDLKITDPGTQHWAIFTFVHDKWQVTPKLTLDLGLRHEYYTPFVGLVDQGGLSNFDPGTNTLRVAGYGSVPKDLGVKTAKDNFAPRTGLSYRIDEKTVLRGGYGVSIIPFPDNQYAYNFPVKQNNDFPGTSFVPSPLNMAGGFPPPITAAIPADGIIPASTALLRGQQYNVVPLDLSEGKIHAWNVAFQRQLPLKFAAEVAYVANRAHGVLGRLELNAGLTPGLDNAGRPYFAPFNRTASSTGWMRTNTRYDSMQVKLDRRYSNGLLWTNSYTLSRSKDYLNDAGTVGTPADIGRSYGLSDFDRTHSFVSSFVYELPFLKNARGPLGAILGGWQVAGVFVAQSGTPIDIRAAGASLRAPQNQQRPDLVGTQKVIGDIGPGQQYFDKSVYVAPPANAFGNMTRNAGPRGPSYVNLDASIVKRFKVNGRIAAELRADAFNATNTPHFANPGRDFGQSNFGQVTGTLGTGDGATGPRLVRFGARVTF
jgi:carboxypeptidase family protein/TonB-dependent receptor-like protein